MYKLINSQCLEAHSYFELELLKISFYKLSAITTKVRKVKVFIKRKNKEVLQKPFQIYVSWSNVIDGKKPFSQSWLILGENLVLNGLSNATMVTFFLSGINLSIFLPLNLAIYRIGNAPNNLCHRCKEQD